MPPPSEQLDFKTGWYRSGMPVVHFFFDRDRTRCGRVMPIEDKARMYDARCQICKKAREQDRKRVKNWRKR